MPFNVEKSAFRHGEWVAYGGGCWRVQRYGKGARTWRGALQQPGNPGGVALAEVYGRTLRDISQAVQQHAKP
jgi:hypothetical protein